MGGPMQSTHYQVFLKSSDILSHSHALFYFNLPKKLQIKFQCMWSRDKAAHITPENWPGFPQPLSAFPFPAYWLSTRETEIKRGCDTKEMRREREMDGGEWEGEREMDGGENERERDGWEVREGILRGREREREWESFEFKREWERYIKGENAEAGRQNTWQTEHLTVWHSLTHLDDTSSHTLTSWHTLT